MLSAVTQSAAASAPAQSAPGPSAQPRLVRAAHEFEAQLMKELLKPLTAANGLTGTDDDPGSSGALGDFAGEALAGALSDQGGFGIANRILGQITPSQSGNRTHSAPVTANLHANTVMSPDK
jgi:Rod binding domain-containing protein